MTARRLILNLERAEMLARNSGMAPADAIRYGVVMAFMTAGVRRADAEQMADEVLQPHKTRTDE